MNPLFLFLFKVPDNRGKTKSSSLVIFGGRNGCPASKEEASTVRALLAPPTTARRPDGLFQWCSPTQFLSPRLPMHQSDGNATHRGWTQSCCPKPNVQNAPVVPLQAGVPLW